MSNSETTLSVKMFLHGVIKLQPILILLQADMKFMNIWKKKKKENISICVLIASNFTSYI